MSDRWVSAIYCDDLRHEIGGKVSHMGVYASEMVLPRFPFTLPRLVAMVRLRTPLGHAPEKVRFAIYRDAVKLAESEMRLSDEKLVDDGSEDRSYYVVCYFAFGALEFSGKAEIRLRCICDDEEIIGNSLMVRLANEEEARTFNFPLPTPAPSSDAIKAPKSGSRPARARSKKLAD